MEAVRPPKGMRDFNAQELARRYFLIDTIKKVFHAHGIGPLETPTMENLSTLTGKYGDEGDQLLFKVLNSGDFLKSIDLTKETGSKELAGQICEKGLRYDLTVPFARYVAQHKNELPMPFKRYQIQPVWRADRPQKGRYREFCQCDADFIGSDSPLCEVEMLEIFNEVFLGLGILDKVAITINNRKILEGLSEVLGRPEKLVSLTVAIDKLDKIGKEKVLQELKEHGIEGDVLDELFSVQGPNSQQLNQLEKILQKSKIGLEGVSELRTVINYCENLGLKQIKLTPTLARGLSYYTGLIYEVKMTNVSIGTVASGGRYANLTGIFGVEGLSGIGLSFGADRLYDVLLELDLFPKNLDHGPDFLFLYLDEPGVTTSWQLLAKARSLGFSGQFYPDPHKMKKQMKYADQRGFSYAVFLGESEIQKNTLTIKNLKTGEQIEINQKEWEIWLKKKGS